MYLDIEKKIEFYKNRIISEFLKIGIYPKDNLIQSEINNIDLGLSIFKAKRIESGEYFKSKEFNEQLNMIYQDLKILYDLLYEITIKEFSSIKAFAECHLEELETKARMYKLRSDQEMNSTLLGKTILFQSDSFVFTSVNNIKIIDLGYFKVHKGAQLACLLDAANIEANKVIFEIKNNDMDLKSNLYNYNQDFMVIPGSLKNTSYKYVMLPDQKIDYPILMDLDKAEANFKNSYVIFSGKNKLLTKTIVDEVNTNSDLINKNEILGRSLQGKTYIDFYVLNGDTITFKFNKNPISTNFKLDKNSQVTNLKPVQHFFIEADKGFSFDFTINKGEIYAIKTKGIVKNKKLYCNTNYDVREFHIIEQEPGEEVTVRGYLSVYNDDGSPIELKYIAVKELIKFGGEL